MDLLKRWHFSFAGLTPRRPEAQNHNVRSQVVAQVKILTVNVRPFEAPRTRGTRAGFSLGNGAVRRLCRWTCATDEHR